MRAVNKDLMGVQVTVILLAWGLCNSFGWLNFREILSSSKIDGILRNIVSSSRNEEMVTPFSKPNLLFEYSRSVFKTCQGTPVSYSNLSVRRINYELLHDEAVIIFSTRLVFLKKFLGRRRE